MLYIIITLKYKVEPKLFTLQKSVTLFTFLLKKVKKKLIFSLLWSLSTAVAQQMDVRFLSGHPLVILPSPHRRIRVVGVLIDFFLNKRERERHRERSRAHHVSSRRAQLQFETA